MMAAAFGLSELVDQALRLPWGALAWFVAILALCFSIEAAVLSPEHSSFALLFRGSRSARCDLANTVASLVGITTVVEVLLTVGLVPLFTASIRNGVDVLPELSLPRWPTFLIALCCVDAVRYWTHRLSHRIAPWWEAHRYHHGATEFTMLTGQRVHVLDTAIEHVVIFGVLAIIGDSVISTFVLVVAIQRVVELLQHSMIPWTFGWFGRWVVYSPVGHRIHHSMEPEHRDKNFGNLSPIWDRLFGTWYAGTLVNESVGLAQNPYNQHGFLHDYLLTARNVGAAIGGRSRIPVGSAAME